MLSAKKVKGPVVNRSRNLFCGSFAKKDKTPKGEGGFLFGK